MDLYHFSEDRNTGVSYIHRHGLGYRVLAPGHNHASLRARYPQENATLHNAHGHLDWSKRVRSPWVSVNTTWPAALRRARWLTKKHCAKEIYIVIIDLEEISSGHVYSAKAVDRYGRYSDRPFFENELLIHREIPEEALRAIVPATGDQVRIETHLAQLTVPRSLVALAGAETDIAICHWIRAEIGSRVGLVDEDLTTRLMQGMCTWAWDEWID